MDFIYIYIMSVIYDNVYIPSFMIYNHISTRYIYIMGLLHINVYITHVYNHGGLIWGLHD